MLCHLQPFWWKISSIQSTDQIPPILVMYLKRNNLLWHLVVLQQHSQGVRGNRRSRHARMKLHPTIETYAQLAKNCLPRVYRKDTFSWEVGHKQTRSSRARQTWLVERSKDWWFFAGHNWQGKLYSRSLWAGRGCERSWDESTCWLCGGPSATLQPGLESLI